MKLRGNALGIGISTVMVAFVAGCSSSNNSGTGGKSGTGGAGTGGADAGAATGGKGMGGSPATDGGADAPADAPGDAPTDRAPDAVADAGPPPVCGPFADGGTPNEVGVGDGGALASFFVASNTAASADLGGLLAADARCQALAVGVGLGNKTWHAYLSVEHGPGGDAGTGPINARDRIGNGPWYNVRGGLVAATLTELHARHGDPTVFIDEHGLMINGQWTGSGTPNEHDILTGTNVDGTVAMGKTCSDWTSGATVPDGGVPDGGAPDGGSYFVARIGHTDGFGTRCAAAPAPPNDVTSWNSAHDTFSCADIRSRGGVGHIYCFAVN
jgi:hypothetical protein